MQKLGERIRHVRGRMSQEAFAGLLGISKGALGGYERGENCPNADVVLTICNKCKINVSWLMSGVGSMHAPDGTGEEDRQKNRPGHPREGKIPTTGELVCQMAPGQDCKTENDALRAHCLWLQERLEQLEAERRDLNRENRLLWQKMLILVNVLPGWSSRRSLPGYMPMPQERTRRLLWRIPAME